MKQTKTEMKKVSVINRLEGSGYTVSKSLSGGLVIDKPGFWGDLRYSVPLERDISHLHLGRTFALCLIWGIGLIGLIYYYMKRDKFKNNVANILRELED